MSSVSSPAPSEGLHPHPGPFDIQTFDDLLTPPDTEQILQVSRTIPGSSVLASQSPYQFLYPSAGERTSGTDFRARRQSSSPSTSQSHLYRGVEGSLQPHSLVTGHLSRLSHASRASASSASHSLSPSSSFFNNQLSPTAAYGSEHAAHSEISEHTTPSFDEDILGATFGDVPNLSEDESLGITDKPTNAESRDEVSSTCPQSDASDHTKRGSLGTTTNSDSHLLSPVLTNTPSPPLGSNRSRALCGDPEPRSRNILEQVPSQATDMTDRPNQIQIPVPDLQNTPALTDGSLGGALLVDRERALAYLRSPVVRVENYSRGESPSREGLLVPSLGKRGRTSQLSPGHLSPHLADESSDEDDLVEDRADQQIKSIQSPAVVPRAKDGSWNLDIGSGQAGIDPRQRVQLNDTFIPTLREQEEHRHIVEKNADVETWLSRSAPGSDAEDNEPPVTLSLRKSKSVSKRRRAISLGNPVATRADALRLDMGERTMDDSKIPGPGVLIDEESLIDDDDDDEEDEHDMTSDDENRTESPPAMYFRTVDEEPLPRQFYRARPWNDPPYDADVAGVKVQPVTSNAAIMRFRQRADNIETASRAATWGTRRMSETDIDKFVGPGGLLKRLSFGKDKDRNKEKGEKSERRGSFLKGAATKLLSKRSNSNLRRRNSQRSHSNASSESFDKTGKQSIESLAPPRRIGSFGRQKPPKLNTGSAVAAMAGQIAAVGGGIGGSVSATATVAPPGPWTQATNFIKRSRSRSELVRSPTPGEVGKPGLARLMSQHGGPPMPTLASPPAKESKISQRPVTRGNDEDDDDDDGEDATMGDRGVMMDLKVRPDPIIPTFDGFKANVRQLNPRLVPFLVDRVSQEQGRRYKKLVDSKVKHLNAVNNRHCSSGKYCFALGGKAQMLQPRTNNGDPEMSYTGYQVTTTGHSDEESNDFGEGAVAAAQFPHGVPLPPVKHLPAEFECPLCFKVKKFQKPSDWTKHVHEDVQPFTCTFANCAEPKSFKRKADWVRHENERHRQLEWWTCNMPDCSHTCYRKDNFVQHLVREHKKPEPKVKATKAAKAAAADKSKRDKTQVELIENWKANVPGSQDTAPGESDQVWWLVENCRYDTPKLPRDEACKFCGNICGSWKKLTVHLAKHMEQISMPVLALLEQKDVTADTIISPFEQKGPQPPHYSPTTPINVPKVEAANISPYDVPPNIVSHVGTMSNACDGYYMHDACAPIMPNYSTAQTTAFTAPAPFQNPAMKFPGTSTAAYTAPSYTQYEQTPQLVSVNAGANFSDARGRSSYGGYDTLSGTSHRPSFISYPSSGVTIPSSGRVNSDASMHGYGTSGTPMSTFQQQASRPSMVGYASGGVSISPYEQQHRSFSSPVEAASYTFTTQPSELQGAPASNPIPIDYNDMARVPYTQTQGDPSQAYTNQLPQNYPYQQ
ncbi:MAG: hypothetical protein M1827_006947 [Pycnora praestabilis]|nr:MAG: hypothetical protein M1827_006947 [Pycnora praestabilis]